MATSPIARVFAIQISATPVWQEWGGDAKSKEPEGIRYLRYGEEMTKPYDWIISDPLWSHWVKTHKIKIDYNNATTWDHRAWGEWRRNDDGPPVQLPSGARFWYIDRRKIAKFMLDKPGRKASLVKEGKRHILRTGYLEVWGSESEEVAMAALAAFNGGDIAKLLAIEPDHVTTVDA